jgi:hypothetical protein
MSKQLKLRFQKLLKKADFVQADLSSLTHGCVAASLIDRNLHVHYIF